MNGLETCSAVAISTKGHMDDVLENERLRENIRLTVDTLPLKTIVIYDVCGSNDATLKTFAYAAEKGIRLITPDNTLKHQNTLRFHGEVMNL